MFKKSISAAVSAAMILPLGTGFGVLAAEPENDAAVSGYVSMSGENGGMELVSTNKTPSMYVDGSDYAGVIRAVNDLKQDMKTVTGREAEITNTIEKNEVKAEGIYIDGDKMTVEIASSPSKDAWCFTAAYNADGSLAGVIKSENTIKAGSDGGTFNFKDTAAKPDGGSLKAFVWSEDMQPMTAALGIAENVEKTDTDIIIGTLGMSKEVDSLAESGKLDVSEIKDKWESFTIQNIDGTVVIAGSDKRGTIYGIYDLCEKMGVSPWGFWADTKPGHADSLYVNLPEGGYTEGEPSVKYRGIFLNDEFNMSEWSKSMGSTGKNMNNETYAKIFELLLRLKANYLWPAMHTYSTAFNVTEGNAALADEYGIVMGSSHAEPLLRNNLGELYDYQQKWTAENPEKTLTDKNSWGSTITDDAKHTVAYIWTDKDNDGNAVDNKEFLTDYWRERAKANGGYENTYTLGMRGVHDGSFNTNMDSKTAMAEILQAQTNILKDEVVKEGQDISDVPQVFIPYKEMLDMYNDGLEIPDYVTLMWPDDNFGYIRQLPTEPERERSGGAGIYYHLSYYGRPNAYLWLSSSQPGLIREEMTKAYDMGADRIWVANVGDLKPAETEIEYFLDLARDVDNMRNTGIAGWLADNAKRDFGFNDSEANEYADIKLGYYQNANSRRPEHMVNGLFSSAYGDEGQKLLDSYASLTERAEQLYGGLSEEKKPSFYELLLYPLRGAKSMAEKYIYSDKAKLYSENGYGSAVNKYSQLSDNAYQNIADDTAEYNTMLGGKWNKMMNPYQTKLSGSFGGPITGKLSNPTVAELPYTGMKAVPENGGLSFTRYSTEPSYVDIINTGTGSFDWRISDVSEPGLRFSKTEGTVFDDDRVYLNIDWSKYAGNKAQFSIEQLAGNTVVSRNTFEVTINADEITDLGDKTYVESDGYVSIEAEHYTDNVINGEYEWKEEKDFGRSGSSMKIYPNTAAAVSSPNKDNSAYLEYDVYFTSAGKFPIDVYRMPTLNEVSGAAMRFDIGVDDASPVRFSGNTKAKDKSDGTDVWGKGVLQNTEVVSGTIEIPSAGMHKIRLYNESAGVVIDKLVITTGNKLASYYGAPESYNTTYNNAEKALPNIKPSQSQTGDIKALFEPDMLITSAENDGEISRVDVLKLSENAESGVLVLALSSGEYTYTQFDMADTPVNEVKTIECAAGGEKLMLLSGVDLNDDNSFEPIAPSYDYAGNAAELSAIYRDGYAYPSADLSQYKGMEAVCVIYEDGAESTDGIKYISQETIDENSFKKIPFDSTGHYKLRIKVSGTDGCIEEDLNTVINITPDNPAVENETVYSQPLSSDPSGDSTVTLNGASFDSTKKAVNMGVGGAMSVKPEKSVSLKQGDVITVKAKIAHGKDSGKYMNYLINSSAGENLANVHVSAYNGTKTYHFISLGNEKVYENTGSLMQAIERTSDKKPGGYTTYTTVINVTSGEITMTVESSKGSETLKGTLLKGISDIVELEFTTDYTTNSCLVKDIEITRSAAESYDITVKAINAETGEAIADAAVTVTDAVTGAVIAPENGVYKLCSGAYNYTVNADGYAEFNGAFNVSPSLESKEITAAMK